MPDSDLRSVFVSLDARRFRRRADLLAEAARGLAEMRLEDLSDIHP